MTTVREQIEKIDREISYHETQIGTLQVKRDNLAKQLLDEPNLLFTARRCRLCHTEAAPCIVSHQGLHVVKCQTCGTETEPCATKKAAMNKWNNAQ